MEDVIRCSLCQLAGDGTERGWSDVRESVSVVFHRNVPGESYESRTFCFHRNCWDRVVALERSGAFAPIFLSFEQAVAS
jgi:hypothetical protein